MSDHHTQTVLYVGTETFVHMAQKEAGKATCDGDGGPDGTALQLPMGPHWRKENDACSNTNNEHKLCLIIIKKATTGKQPRNLQHATNKTALKLKPLLSHERPHSTWTRTDQLNLRRNTRNALQFPYGFVLQCNVMSHPRKRHVTSCNVPYWKLLHSTAMPCSTHNEAIWQRRYIKIRTQTYLASRYHGRLSYEIPLLLLFRCVWTTLDPFFPSKLEASLGTPLEMDWASRLNGGCFLVLRRWGSAWDQTGRASWYLPTPKSSNYNGAPTISA